MKFDKLVIALRRLLQCYDIEIISDETPVVNVGDVIRLRKHNDSNLGAYALWQDDSDIDTISVQEVNDEIDEESDDENYDDDDDEVTQEAEVSFPNGTKYHSCKFATNAFALSWAAVQNTPHIAIVTGIDRNDHRIHLMYAILSATIRKDFPLDIVLTDKAIGKGSFSAVSAQMKDKYSFQIGQETFMIVGHNIFGHESNFLLLDGQDSLTVSEEYRSECGGNPNEHGTEKVWAALSGSRPYHHDENYRIEIWQGELVFSDATRASILAESARALLRTGNEKYISLWKRYAEIDFEYVTECKNKAGELFFTKLIDNTPERAELQIDNYNHIPAFRNMLEEVDKESMLVSVASAQNPKHVRHASLIGFTERTIIVSFDEERSLDISSGIIYVNTHSAETQFQRRQDAYNKILSMKSAKPGLLSLLNGTLPQLSNEKKRITPLSQSIIDKVFPKHAPTPNQIEAIKIALNTPDFAIIQGPPGTGKTTVIRAIYEALSEKEKEPQLFFGRNLATAYQRDATVHLASDMDIYGLPAQTFLGRKKGSWDEGNRSVGLWLEKTKQKVFDANPTLEGFVLLDKFSNELDLLRLNFNAETAIDEKRKAALQSFLYEVDNFERLITEKEPESFEEFQVQETCESIDLEEFKQKANALLAEIEDHHSHEHDVDLCYAVMLPTTPEAMEDNGIKLIHEALRRLSDNRQDKIVRDMANALKTLYSKEPIKYDRINDGVNAIVAHLRQRSDLIVNQQANKAFVDLIEATIDAIQNVVGNDELYVLSHYINAFDDMDTMRESLSRFLTVIAATNQMVGSQDVKDRKNPSKRDTKEKSEETAEKEKRQSSETNSSDSDYDSYENIVIDEAARSCPPDLLIPLCRAKDRMILVGDQKQLPQFISENVYKRMASEKQDTELLKKSMFEYLIGQVKELSNTSDGTPRYIMLDQQFRMPAIIGDIVSKYYYEGKLKSPLGNGGEKLPTGLSFTMKNGSKNERISRSHLVWLNVAGHAGTREQKDNKSTYRDEEIRRVAEMLKVLISSGDTAKKYKYGIITFYKAQESRLKKAVRSALLEGEQPVCSEEWYNLHVEIGTVDAFQGKEFDIVFLSMVRCHTDYGSFRYGEEEKGRATYGFTMDENRLCVALSRVIRCLIIAGDENMFNTKEAEQIMPAINEMLNICKKSEEGSENYAWYIPDNSSKKNA